MLEAAESTEEQLEAKFGLSPFTLLTIISSGLLPRKLFSRESFPPPKYIHLSLLLSYY